MGRSLELTTREKIEKNPEIAAQIQQARQGMAAAQQEAGATLFMQDGELVGLQRASKEFERGMKAVIYAAENANLSTFTHEWFHFIDVAYIGRSEQHRRLFEDALGKRYDELTAEDREKLAYSFERYLKDGSAPSDSLKSLFSRIAKAMARAISAIAKTMNISPELRKGFDALFQGDSQLKQDVNTDTAREGSQGSESVQPVQENEKPGNVPSKVSDATTGRQEGPEIVFQMSAPEDTPAFRSWFRKSKAVNPDGSPMVLYHGTFRSFDKFDLSYAKEGEGSIFTTPSVELANEFTHRGPWHKNQSVSFGSEEANAVMRKYPEVMDALERSSDYRETIKEIAREVKDHLDELEGTRDMMDEAQYSERVKADKDWLNALGVVLRNLDSITVERDAGNIMPLYLSAQNPLVVDVAGESFNSQRMIDILTAARNQGHDGAIIKNIEDYGVVADQYVAFQPTQVKSVFNKGAWSQDDSRVLFQHDIEEVGPDLVAVHNISDRSLAFADEVGGIAMPSLAVIKKGIPFSNYGDITLIAPKDLIDPKANSAAKVFNADVYSPRYPDITYKVDEKILMPLAEEIASTIKMAYENSSDSFYKNRAPSKYTVIESLKDAIENNRVEYIGEKQDIKAFWLIKNEGLNPDIAELRRVDLTAEQRNQLKDWANKELEQARGAAVIFKGFTNSGNRRYVPATIENIYAEMKKANIRGGETMNYGLPSIRALVAKQYKSLSAISKDKKNIVSDEDFQQAKKDTDALYEEILHESYNSDTRNDFGDALAEGIERGNIAAALKENGFNMGEEWLEKINILLSSLREMPTHYFEAKIKGIITLDQFVGAVIPDNAPTETKEALEKAGLRIESYEAGNSEDRSSAIQRIAADDPRILFQEAPPPDSPAFKAWFGDSKVVDAEGKPLVVYHGTDSIFEEFDATKGRKWAGKVGFWFTDSQDMASTFGDNQMPVFLSIKNPVVVSVTQFNVWREKHHADENFWKQKRSEWESEGHDGFVVKGQPETFAGQKMPAQDTYAAFAPTQVKSVNNRGTWDGNDPRILFQPAYHGTPHTVDRFSTDKIGTGEGAQAYGWGLYFAETKKVAEWYRKTLSSQYTDIIATKKVEIAVKPYIDESIANGYRLEHIIRSGISNGWVDIGEELENLMKKSRGQNKAFYERDLAVWKKYSEDVRNSAYRVAKDSVNAGHIYKVSIPEHEDYLDWDKPLSEQSEKVKILLLPVVETYRKPQVSEGFEFLAEGIDDTDVSSLTGEEIYTRLSSDKHGDKSASLYLYSLGIRGIRYLDGSSRRKGEGNYNYVIFDEKDVENTEVLFQLTDPEIDAEARTFESWQDWKDYVEGFAIPAMDEDTRAPGGADLDAWYKTRWEQANGINRDEAGQEIDQTPELTSDEIDDRFRDRIREDGELERFLEELQQARTNDYEHGAMDAEEALAREEAEALKSRIEAEAHPTLLNNAVRLSMGREITPRARKAILTLMDQGARYYRSLYAEVTGDAEFAALSDREIDTMPEIQDTDEKALSIVDRVKLANKIKSERVRKELMRGDLIPDDVMVLIDQLDQEKAELSAKLRAAEKEIAEDNQLFTRQERIFVENRTKIADLQKSLQKNERDMAQAEKKLAQVRAREKAGRAAERERRGKLAEAYKAKAEKLRDTIADQRQEMKDLRAATKDAMASARAEAVMQKKNAVDKLKDEIRAKEEERREAAKVIAYKRKLVAQIMAKPSREIWYEDAEKIRAIQRVVDPKARAATVKWAGETYEIQAFREKAINENLVDILPKSLINRLFKKSLDEWTVSELEEMAAQVERLKSVGRTTWGLKENERKYDEWKDRKDTIDQHASDPKLENAAAAGSKERREQLKKLDSGFRKLATVTWTTSRIADWLDGGKPGAHTKLLVTEEREAYAAKMDNMDRRTKKITDLMKEKGVDVRSLYETEHTISGIGPAGADVTFTTSDLMYLMVGLKDANTRAAILYGNLMDQSERSTWDNDTLKSMGRDKVQALERSVRENLSEAEKEIAEAIGRDFRDEFGRLNDVFLNEFNMVMKQVDSYVPMIRQDVTASGEQHEAQQAQELLNVAGVSIKRTPEKGFSVSRVKISPRNQRAIKLDLYGTWMDAVERQEHFAAYTRYIRKLNGVYKNTQNSESRLLRHLITQTHGSEVLKRVDQEINALANPQSFRDDRNIDRLVRTLRGSLGSAYLAWKTSSILKQAVTSPAPYLAYVSAADMSSSAFEFMADYNGMSEMVRSKSAVMRHRVANPILEAIKIAQKDSKGKKGLTTINAVGMKGLEVIDWVSVATGWNAVYKKALYEGATEKEAVAKADDVTIKIQPSAREQDLAPLFKTGSEGFKLITQFQTALNVIWNNFTYDLPNAVRNKQWGFVVGTIGSYAVAGIGLGLMTEGLKGDDDEPDHSRWIYWSMSQALDSVPLIGAGVSAVARQAITGEKRQFYASSVFPAADELLSAASRATAGDWDKAAVDFAESVGIGLGLPVSGVKEAIAAPGNPGRLIGRR